MAERLRLDVLLVERGLAESRQRAAALILAGKVRVEGRKALKAGQRVAPDVEVEVLDPGEGYVSRGGFKLASALDTFSLEVAGLVSMDVGASTGGFTDVLLQRGTARVYAIDVGYGQLAWKLRQNPKVVVMERTNARYLETLPEPVNLVTIDVSFISLRLILPAVVKWLSSSGWVVALVKPQFEAGRSQVGKGGVVREKAVHRQVLENVVAYAQDVDLNVMGLIPSPITGPAGNHEFLLYLGWQTAHAVTNVEVLIEDCLAMLYPSSG